MLPQIRRYQPARQLRRQAVNGSDLFSLFDEAFSRDLNGWSAWTPTADLYETGDDFVLEMGLPGFVADDVEVTVERGVLTVSGQRASEEEEDARQYHVREQVYDRFARSFALPASVTSEEVTAEFDNGMLTVRLPKVAEAKPRRVKIAAR